MNYFPPYVDQDPGAWNVPDGFEVPPNDELRAARGVVRAIALGALAWAFAVVVVRLLNLAIDTAWAAAQVYP